MRDRLKDSILEDPPATPYAECPNCGRLIQIGVSRCPDCYELIDVEYAMTSGAVVLINTKACAMANTIQTLDPLAVLAIGVAVLAYVCDLPSGFLLSAITGPTLALVAIVVWFVRFGWFKIGDEDFVRARQSMLVRLIAWLVLAVVLSSFVYLAVSSPP